VKNRSVLEPMLSGVFMGDTAENWFRKLSAAGVPCSPVRSMDEVVKDPQAAVRGMFPTLDHVTAGPFTVTGPPIKLSATPARVSTAAPLLGEHTRQALAELLDLDPAELDKLESAEVIVAAALPAGDKG
jgi:CoA:oxalate CoA-transferase